MRFFRLNYEESDRDKVLALIAEEGFSCREFSGLHDIMAASHEPFSIGNSMAHYFGFIYVQDISSMLPVLLLNPLQNSIVLDMCASPGGKTGQLSRIIGPKGMVVANEPNPSRLATLRANLKRLNLINVITSGLSGQDLALDGLLFDYILLDVPCSGWGTLKKNPRADKVWTGEKLTGLIILQKLLLKTASKMLAPGGRLVYSTCTTNNAENEDQIHWAQKELPLKIIESGLVMPGSGPFPDIEIAIPGMMRVKGAIDGGQDFFMAALTSSSDERSPERIVNHKILKKSHGEPVAFDMDEGRQEFGGLWNFSGNVFFVPHQAWAFINKGLWAQGIHVGKIKGKKFMLSPRMRTFLPREKRETAFKTMELDQVKRLVCGQSLEFSSSRSLVGFYWNDLGLGWLKVKNKRLLWSDR